MAVLRLFQILVLLGRDFDQHVRESAVRRDEETVILPLPMVRHSSSL